MVELFFFWRNCSRINLTIYIIFLLKNIMKVMVDTLTKRKIENPTPIQMQVIIHHESFLLFVCLYVFVRCFLSYFAPSYLLLSFLFFSVLICPSLCPHLSYFVLFYLVSVSCSYSFRLDFLSCNKFCLLFDILQLPSESRKQKCCGSGSGRILWFTTENVPPPPLKYWGEKNPKLMFKM